jgi:Uncharacterised nucleotidyltransferase
MRALNEAGVEYMVGGAYAFARYTGIVRHTKDFDVFVHPRDFERALAALEQAGYPVERNFPHWLGKAWCGEYFVDLIFSSGNGVARVDRRWFEHAVEETVLGVEVKLCPAEEMIWSKAFIMERERFDGADVAHLLRRAGRTLDWDRLRQRFDGNWQVLYAHLVLFSYIYPGERDIVPRQVIEQLSQRLIAEGTQPDAAARELCRGTILSRAQYLVDVERWGYLDPRLAPHGNLTEQEAETWTAGIADDGPPGALQAA